MEDEAGGAILAQAARDGFISEENRARLAASLGPQGVAAFDGWLQDKGITVQGPPTMDEEEPVDGVDATEGTGGLDGLGGLGVTDIGSLSGAYSRNLGQQRQLAQEQAEQRRLSFERARQAIEQQRFGAPTTSEKLFRLSQALLSPQQMPGWRGSLQNMSNFAAGNATALREANEKRAAALLQLQQQYEGAGFADRRAVLESEAGMLGKLAPLVKPKPRRTGFNPVTGELADLDTGEAITAPAPQAGEIKVYKGRQYRFVGGDRYDQKNWQEVR